MRAIASTRLQRDSILWLAQLALIGMAFQIFAIDHWFEGHVHAIGHVRGVEGSPDHVHAMHCHGDLGGCSDAVKGKLSLAETPLVPLPPQTFVTFRVDFEGTAAGAFIPTPTEPPRSA